MLFKDKKKLEEEYYEWIEKHHYEDCPFNVISFLQIKGLLITSKKECTTAINTIPIDKWIVVN